MRSLKGGWRSSLSLRAPGCHLSVEGGGSWAPCCCERCLQPPPAGPVAAGAAAAAAPVLLGASCKTPVRQQLG